MTMGNIISGAIGQSARATAPDPPTAMPLPVTPSANSSTVAADVAGPAAAANEREAGSGHAGFLTTSPIAVEKGHSLFGGGAPPIIAGRKRRADGDDSANPANAKKAKTDSPVAVDAAGPAAAAAAAGREREAGSSIFGGGAPSSIPSLSRKKRRAQDDEDAYPADAKRARTEEAAATVNEEASRGQKRTAESVADSTALGRVKRRRIALESADEEIIRADLPISARDVVRAAQGSALARFVPVIVPKGEHVSTGGASFLSLPPEIREMVYRHLLVTSKPVVPRVEHRPPHYSVGFPIRTVVSLLLSHRTVYKETLGFMLMNNTFKLSIKHHRHWFHLIGRHSVNCLRSIIVECDGKNKHAFENMTAFQNTLRKRTSPRQFREVTYRFLWTMAPDVAVRTLSLPGAKTNWKAMKRLEKITLEINDQFRTHANLVEKERTERVFSRVCLESGRPVRGKVMRGLKRSVEPRPFIDVKLKEGWRKYVTIDKKDWGKMVVKDEDWDHVVELTLIPSPPRGDPSNI